MKPFEIFCACPPGLEPALLAEMQELQFNGATAQPGGVSVMGLWPSVMRANLHLRGATRVLARIGSFRSFNLSQFEKQCRDMNWAALLVPGSEVRVDVTSRASKIYHAGAAKSRLERCLTERAAAHCTAEADIKILARIDANLVTLSIDTSGAPLHKRGYKQAIGKAPMRETLAALFLRSCGYTGSEPVLDPMCGSGSFVLEAADIASARAPGRSRSFAFEQLTTFMPDRWAQMRSALAPTDSPFQFFGADRNEGAIANARTNAERAGTDHLCQFTCAPISALPRPEGPAGLVILNPPYGTRIGEKKQLFALYNSIGQTLKERFKGWRVGIITTQTDLAQATKLPFDSTSAPIPHGGLKVRLFQTKALR